MEQCHSCQPRREPARSCHDKSEATLFAQGGLVSLRLAEHRRFASQHFRSPRGRRANRGTPGSTRRRRLEGSLPAPGPCWLFNFGKDTKAVIRLRSLGSTAELVKACPDSPGEAPEMAHETALVVSPRALGASEASVPGKRSCALGFLANGPVRPSPSLRKTPSSDRVTTHSPPCDPTLCHVTVMVSMAHHPAQVGSQDPIQIQPCRPAPHDNPSKVVFFVGAARSSLAVCVVTSPMPASEP